MKVVTLAAALLAFSIPAFGQVEPTAQPSTPAIPGNCQAALVSPGVPSAIVVLTVPSPGFPTGGSLRPAQPSAHGIVTRPSPRPAGVVAGSGTLSGIGSMTTSGIGSIGTGGIGSMTTSGVGSIGMGGIGSIGNSSAGLPPSPSSPFASPLLQSPVVGSSLVRSNAIAPPPVDLRRLPFICP